VGEVLDDLVEHGLLSEARMAEVYVAERLRKGFGPLRVRHELREKGLSDDLIEPHLSLADERWAELMTDAAAKKFGGAPARDGKELARRARFLEYRGFPADLIARYLDGARTD
jgi:regulatory protein